ncbi:MAG: hypothetical protein RI101_12980 [Nitrospira sp.]|jgi:hypothetical protein|nr:hypothetical protein [Nitrospira sp.]
MKPILFHDIDGVLFGEYDGQFQLRPGVSSWLRWAVQTFDLVWLTSWDREKLHTLLRGLYLDDVIQQSTYGDWMNYQHKEAWLERAHKRLNGRAWYWVDDIHTDISTLPAESCVLVNPKGRDELERLKTFLSGRLSASGTDMAQESIHHAHSSRF